jgi:SulP family sulfate permease
VLVPEALAYATSQASRPSSVVVVSKGGLFFANADTVSREIQARAAEGTQAVVLDAETVPYIDVTAAQMLAETAEDLERRGIKLVLARDVGQVRHLLERAEGEPTLTAYPTVQAAVEAVARGAGDG